MKKIQTFLSLQPLVLTADVKVNVKVKVKVKVKFTLEQATIAQNGSKVILVALFFL
jgi:hypothetical protein